MEKTPQQILTEAADLLENGGWTWRQQFLQEGSSCKMCAHGAIAYCGDPTVKARVDAGDMRSSNFWDAMNAGMDLPVKWKPTPVNTAHFNAGKVGLTTYFNDRQSNKQPIIAKLREAAQLQ